MYIQTIYVINTDHWIKCIDNKGDNAEKKTILPLGYRLIDELYTDMSQTALSIQFNNPVNYGKNDCI